MPDLKRLKGYAKFISITIAIQIAFEGLNGLSQVASFVAGPAPSGEPETWPVTFIVIGAAQLLFGLPPLVLLFVNAFAVCQWMYRCYLNLEAVKTPGLKDKATMAAAYWFVPLVNIIKPYYVTKEIFIASDSADTEAIRKDLRKAAVPGYLPLWWTCWVGQGLIGQLSYHWAKSEGKLSVPSNYVDLVNAIANLLSVVAGILLIKIVKEITARQQAKIPELNQL